MTSMTTDQHIPARDQIGRFAAQEHSSPELRLEEQYLDDHADGSDFDVHEYYDAVHSAAPRPTETYDEWATRQRQGHQLREDEFPAGTGFDTGHTTEEEEAFHSWLEENRTPEGMDEQFDRPDPSLTPVELDEQITIGAWGSVTPF